MSGVQLKEALEGRAASSASTKANLRALQALRALAALAVVAFHVNNTVFSMAEYWIDRPFGGFFDMGHAGVEFFFVLSGFIILVAHQRDIDRPQRLTSFLWKRFRRIYPVYWFLIAALIPVFLLNPSFGKGDETSTSTLVNSVLLVRLLPYDGLILGVSWTLFHEILFYATFALLIVNKRIGVVAMSFWLLASFPVLALGSELSQTVQFFFSPLHLLFPMGMMAAWASERLKARAHIYLMIGLLLFTLVAVKDVSQGNVTTPPISLLYGVTSAIILASAVELERSGRLWVPGILVLLGDASYSIYLVHPLALSVLAKVFVKFGLGAALPHRFIFVLIFVLGAGAGVLFHLIIEKRLLKLIPR